MKNQIDQMMSDFFEALSFDEGGRPPYHRIYDLFLDNGLLIKSSLSVPEIASVAQFIKSRLAWIASGQLTSFTERELAETTEVFGGVAHRFSVYEKAGVHKGVPFRVRGLISTQFVKTPVGWKIGSMAWDDERPGQTVPERFLAALVGQEMVR